MAGEAVREWVCASGVGGFVCVMGVDEERVCARLRTRTLAGDANMYARFVGAGETGGVPFVEAGGGKYDTLVNVVRLLVRTFDVSSTRGDKDRRSVGCMGELFFLVCVWM